MLEAILCHSAIWSKWADWKAASFSPLEAGPWSSQWWQMWQPHTVYASDALMPIPLPELAELW